MEKTFFQNKRRKIAVLIPLAVMLIINSIGLPSAFAADEDIIVFTDDNLKSALITAGVDTGGDGEITQGELGVFSAPLDLSQSSITNLSGMEYAVSITSLNLGGNTISSISALSNLTQLATLDLSGNNISDISALSALTQLTTLDLSGNSISGISALSELAQLTALDVSNNYLDTTDGSDDMAVIIALQDGGCTVVYTPQKDIPVQSVALDISSVTLCPQDTKQLTETVSPADAADKTVTWTSSNENIATVSQGLITAAAVGSATITATTQDGGFTAECAVTVKSACLDSSVYSIDQTKNILHNIMKGTSAAQLITNMANDAQDITIYDKNGALYTGDSVSTGMSVKLVINGILRDELKLAVLGDGNGDGDINILDYTLARLDILELKNLTGEFAQAIDVNGNGEISITDYTLIRLDILDLKILTGKVEFSLDVTDPNIMEFLTMALAQQGDPYVWGDEGPNTFDCSGFVHYCLNQVGYHIGRSTADTYSRREQWAYVAKENLQPGDLMFYFSDNPDDGDHIGHIGIYLGDGYHIHASSLYGCVIICRVEGWYSDMLSHGRRVNF